MTESLHGNASRNHQLPAPAGLNKSVAVRIQNRINPISAFIEPDAGLWDCLRMGAWWESKAQSPADPALTESTGSGDRSKRRRFIGPAVLLGLGVAAGIGAFFAYPSPETGIPIPSPPELYINTAIPVNLVDYSVSQISPQVAKLVVTVRGGLTNASGAPKPAASGTLQVTLPLGFVFQDCPPGPCVNAYDGIASYYTKPLAYGIESAADTFLVRAADFGVNYDGVYAYAAIPEIKYQLASSAQATALHLIPSFTVGYSIPSAGSYDWSAFPATVRGSSITWQQFLSSDTPGRTASGINHTAEADAANWTFAAGILAGCAASGLFGAVQMLLPSGDKTSKSSRRASGEGAA